jgi:hypothetical protein
MDYAVDFSSLMSKQVANLDLMVGSSSYQISYQSLTWSSMLWSWQVRGIEEFSCDALLPTILLQLWSHSCFLSHTLMGSNYRCYVNFLSVVFGNDVMTNDWWCRDESESQLWCTHGWVARHALVSRLIVVIHYKTILMCYLLGTLSQNDRCILSQHVAIFYPNLSTVSCQIPSHEFASIFSLGVTCFSNLKDPHSNLGTRFFLRGEGCDTPGVSFVLWCEIYPNLGCSVKISISRSRMSLTIPDTHSHFTNSELFSLMEGQIWSMLKLLFLGTNANSMIILNLSNSSKARLIKRSTVASRAVSESDSSNLDRCPTILIRVRTRKRNTQYVVL